MELLTLRDQEPKTSQAFASLSANIRMRLKQYSSQVQELKFKVNEANRQHTMYPYKFYFYRDFFCIILDIIFHSII
jgi:hypothetical protein